VTHEVFEVSFEGGLSVISQRTNTLTHTIDLGPGHWVGLAVDPYTGNAYAASETYDDTGKIDVISARTNPVSASITACDNPHAIAVDPYKQDVYVANYCEPSSIQGSVSVMSGRTA
jgi:DNA-binding beta-propeller fold protein YncE